MDRKPRILFTTQLSEQRRTELENGKFLIESEPFITFEYLMPALWRSEVPENADAWIFTSKKAVKAVSPVILDLELPRHIFAVGAKTGEKLQELGLKVSIPEEYNAKSLAAMMRQLEFQNVVYFCGNLKAANWNRLLGDDVNLSSIEVYNTKLTSHKMDDLNDFDGIVFMSPSAVDSFSRQNTISDDMQVFCIGPTTEEAARDAGIMNGIIPEYFTVDSLMETIEGFYT